MNQVHSGTVQGTCNVLTSVTMDRLFKFHLMSGFSLSPKRRSRHEDTPFTVIGDSSGFDRQ